MSKKLVNYFTPALLSVIIFGSNFLNTGLFEIGFQNFTVWFCISLFAFATGWYINKTMGWQLGGKILFAVTIATTIFSVLLVSFFSGYFGFSELLTENLILYSLRNITLGAMGIFGMSVAELMRLQRVNESLELKNENLEGASDDAKREAELTIKEAKLNAEKIIFEAQKKSDQLLDQKNKLERNLKEFIQTERELLKKYEEE